MTRALVCWLVCFPAFPNSELGSPLGQGKTELLCSHSAAVNPWRCKSCSNLAELYGKKMPTALLSPVRGPDSALRSAAAAC